MGLSWYSGIGRQALAVTSGFESRPRLGGNGYCEFCSRVEDLGLCAMYDSVSPRSQAEWDLSDASIQLSDKYLNCGGAVRFCQRVT